MKPSEFKHAYEHTGKRWKDADELVQQLSESDRRRLYDALVIVDDFTGLDMRQNFYKSILKHSTV